MQPAAGRLRGRDSGLAERRLLPQRARALRGRHRPPAGAPLRWVRHAGTSGAQARPAAAAHDALRRLGGAPRRAVGRDGVRRVHDAAGAAGQRLCGRGQGVCGPGAGRPDGQRVRVGDAARRQPAGDERAAALVGGVRSGDAGDRAQGGVGGRGRRRAARDGARAARPARRRLDQRGDQDLAAAVERVPGAPYGRRGARAARAARAHPVRPGRRAQLAPQACVLDLGRGRPPWPRRPPGRADPRPLGTLSAATAPRGVGSGRSPRRQRLPGARLRATPAPNARDSCPPSAALSGSTPSG